MDPNFLASSMILAGTYKVGWFHSSFRFFLFFLFLCSIHCFVIHHHLSNFKQPCPNTQRISP